MSPTSALTLRCAAFETTRRLEHCSAETTRQPHAFDRECIAPCVAIGGLNIYSPNYLVCALPHMMRGLSGHSAANAPDRQIVVRYSFDTDNAALTKINRELCRSAAAIAKYAHDTVLTLRQSAPTLSEVTETPFDLWVRPEIMV